MHVGFHSSLLAISHTQTRKKIDTQTCSIRPTNSCTPSWSSLAILLRSCSCKSVVLLGILVVNCYQCKYACVRQWCRQNTPFHATTFGFGFYKAPNLRDFCCRHLAVRRVLQTTDGNRGKQQPCLTKGNSSAMCGHNKSKKAMCGQGNPVQSSMRHQSALYTPVYTTDCRVDLNFTFTSHKRQCVVHDRSKTCLSPTLGYLAQSQV